MTAVTSTDPRPGRVVATVTDETSAQRVDELCRTAERAAPTLEALGRPFRADLMRALADALEADRTTIVALADRESALGDIRCNGELTRTCHQLRTFADAVVEGSHVEAIIDHAGDTPLGPRPDLRRIPVLPAELRDDPGAARVPRRIDGVLRP